MGYTTNFTGELELDKPLEKNHFEYLEAFSRIRHMKRDPNKLGPDPLREAVNLSAGAEGQFYVGEDDGNFGQTKDDSIVDYNSPGQCPSLWCQWECLGNKIRWDEGEKFYNYSEWLEFLIEHFLKPWGYVTNGSIEWVGEGGGDEGIIYVKDNVFEAVGNVNSGPSWLV